MKWIVRFPKGNEFNGYSEFIFEPYDADLAPCDSGLTCQTPPPHHVDVDLPSGAGWEAIPAMLEAWYPNGEITGSFCI